MRPWPPTKDRNFDRRQTNLKLNYLISLQLAQSFLQDRRRLSCGQSLAANREALGNWCGPTSVCSTSGPMPSPTRKMSEKSTPRVIKMWRRDDHFAVAHIAHFLFRLSWFRLHIMYAPHDHVVVSSGSRCQIRLATHRRRCVAHPLNGDEKAPAGRRLHLIIHIP